MPIAMQKFQQAHSGVQPKTGVDAEFLITALLEASESDSEAKAYSTTELYRIVMGEEPTDSDLRAFVGAWNGIWQEDRIKPQYHQMLLKNGYEAIERRRVGESGYENWHFALIPIKG